MEHLNQDVRPSILIVEPDNRVRSLIETFFSRAGWFCESWNGESKSAPWKKERVFDVVIADSISLEWESWNSLRMQQQKNPNAALVLLVNPDSKKVIDSSDDRVLCCIEKGAAPRSIESMLFSLVDEYDRVRKEGRLSARARVPMESQITIESFTSRELSANLFPFPVLVQLQNAGLLDLKEKLKIQLALEEALANSLEHGNLELASIWREDIDAKGCDKYSQIKKQRLEDPHYADRIVTIVSDFDGDRLLIRLTDQGKGFTPTEKEQSGSSNIEPAVFGRGMALIESTVDEVTYSCGGRQISLVKKIVRAGKD